MVYRKYVIRLVLIQTLISQVQLDNMNRVDSKYSQNDPNNRFMTYQQRNNPRQYTKSKSSKKNQIINRNIIIPCEPLGQKLFNAAIDKNQRKPTNQLKRQKTQQTNIQSSLMSLEGSRCVNHADKIGEYFLQSQPNKKFCLKCNLTLNAGNGAAFITKQKQLKKLTLDNFKQQLSKIKHQIEISKQTLTSSIQNSQHNFSVHSNYINQSFQTLRQQLQEKRRQLLNNLIIAQQSVKRMFEDNMKRVKKMAKSIERYQMDIKRFYDQIIQELPKSEFDHIMQEYQNKINKNFKSKLKSILIQDGICVYIPNVQIKNILEKSNVEFYQPVNEISDSKPPALSFSEKEESKFEQKRNVSNSLDSKMNDFISNICLQKRPPEFTLLQKKRQPELCLFDKRTADFVSPNQKQINSRNLVEDKQNINLQNFDHIKNDVLLLGRVGFK